MCANKSRKEEKCKGRGWCSVVWCGVMFYLEKIEMAWRGLDEVLSLGFL